MRLLVFGATGRTGRHLTALAESCGWSVHASGRDPVRLAELGASAGCSISDVADAAALERVVRSARPEAIVATIGGALPDGGFADEVGNITIAQAAESPEVRGDVQISSLACGDSRPYASERIVAAIGPILDAKTRAEDDLRRRDLDWTIIRPGGLGDGEATGNGAVYDDPTVHGRISCIDLAMLVLRSLATAPSIRRTLSAIDRATLPAAPQPPREFVLASLVRHDARSA
jgi:uncharacterized protein YbjT (DUF2867 family)